MFKFCNLYSGSSGNSSLVESDNAKILVDCGTRFKNLLILIKKIQFIQKNF